MSPNDKERVRVLEAELQYAMQVGDAQTVSARWQRIIELDPNHVAALTALSQRAFLAGDLLAARQHLERLVAVDGKDQQQWINLALVCQQQGDEVTEERAIKEALTIEPSDLLGLLMRGSLFERRGDRHRAAMAYGAASAVAPPSDRLAPQLQPLVAGARAYREKYDRELGEFLDGSLREAAGVPLAEAPSRFRDAVDIMVGRKRRYDSLSASFHYPGLPTVEFFDRADFPWMEALEARTDAIRDEFGAVLAADAGFEPYIQYDADVPVNQWEELNHNPNWSAFHLLKDGMPVVENATRCPTTMAALEGVPGPVQVGKTPVAMFSLLKPRTRIPSHSGVSNVRLVSHLPLIVPPGCGFRVGNTTREWQVGRAWAFDDTIEHEAWNDSDALRVVLIFDVWNPFLSHEERALISALAESTLRFKSGAGGGFEL